MRIRPAIVALAVSFTLSCGGDPSGPTHGPPAYLTVGSNPLLLPQLSSKQLRAIVYDTAGQELDGYTATYSSADTAILQVSTTGLLTSRGPADTVDVEVRAAGLVTVLQAVVYPVPLSLVLQPQSATVPQLQSVQLTPVLTT